MELHIVSGSVVLGSDSTPSVIVANFERTDGTVEITDVSSSQERLQRLLMPVSLNM